jgi:hypothetical protein
MNTPNPNTDQQKRAAHTPATLQDGLAVAARLRVRDRFAARWCSRHLDAALAAGTPTETSAALALRARRLTDLSRRRSIAAALRRVVREALEGASRPMSESSRPGARSRRHATSSPG